AVQHPATEARSRSAAVTLDVWTGESGMHPGTQLLKPMAQQLLESRPDHFTCSQQQLLIPVAESEDALQIFEIVPGHRRLGYGTVVVALGFVGAHRTPPYKSCGQFTYCPGSHCSQGTHSVAAPQPRC